MSPTVKTAPSAAETDRARLTLSLKKTTITFIKTTASASGITARELIEQWAEAKLKTNKTNAN
jgi:predicted DNA binding CopG/RHH family protein